MWPDDPWIDEIADLTDQTFEVQRDLRDPRARVAWVIMLALVADMLTCWREVEDGRQTGSGAWAGDCLSGACGIDASGIGEEDQEASDRPEGRSEDVAGAAQPPP